MRAIGLHNQKSHVRGRGRETVSRLAVYGVGVATRKIPLYLFNKQVDDEECEELFLRYGDIPGEGSEGCQRHWFE